MEEEDDEIHSLPPPSPPGDGGRIAVTVASTPPLPPPPQQPRSPPRSSQPTKTTYKAGGGGREDCWSEGATGVLIDAWGERYLELSRGNLKQKHWKEVAEIVSSRDYHSKTPKTDIQCKNRIDTVKKKYKLEKARSASGGAASKWVFFDKLDRLIGPTAKMSKIPIGIPVRASSNANFNASNQSSDRKKQMDPLQIHKKRPQPVAAGMETEEEEGGEDAAGSPERADSLPLLPLPPPVKKRRTALEAEVRGEEEVRDRGKWRRRRRRSDGVRELMQAILRFGEMYEKVESAKLMQMVEMEKQRMKFVKELELQRMQLLVKTQLEISQLKVKGTRRRRKRKGGGNSNGNQLRNCNDDVDNDNNDDNSDSSN